MAQIPGSSFPTPPPPKAPKMSEHNPKDLSSEPVRVSETPTIYIVQGTTGEYSDRTEWLVRAFTREQDAKDEVGRLTHLWMGLRCEETWSEEGAAAEAEMRKHDPGFCVDYTGTSWRVLECPLSDGFSHSPPEDAATRSDSVAEGSHQSTLKEDK